MTHLLDLVFRETSESLASFTTGDLYDHHDADGFITLFGLSLIHICGARSGEVRRMIALILAFTSRILNGFVI